MKRFFAAHLVQFGKGHFSAQINALKQGILERQAWKDVRTTSFLSLQPPQSHPTEMMVFELQCIPPSMTFTSSSLRMVASFSTRWSRGLKRSMLFALNRVDVVLIRVAGDARVAHCKRMNIMLWILCRFLHHPFRRDLEVASLGRGRARVEDLEENILVLILLDPLQSTESSRTYQVHSCAATWKSHR